MRAEESGTGGGGGGIGVSGSNGSGTGIGIGTGTGAGAASGNAMCPMPKHIPFPEMPNNSELLNELLTFLFITCAAAMQFINIYRTVWWLPHSNINNTVNLYLIEPYLIALIVAMSGRRLVYCVLLRALELALQSSKSLPLYKRMLRYGYSGLLFGALGFCIAKIYARHTYLSLFLLVYPFIVYLLIFGFRIEPFLRSASDVHGIYMNGMPMHSCSTSPTAIRNEIDVLRNDFNERFKQIIFTSVMNAYYAGSVPCFFANAIHYNIVCATQHVLFVWLSGLTLCTVFLFPAKYSDILHRAALHLGHWTRMDHAAPSGGGGVAGTLNVMATMAVAWNKSLLWTNGSVVRHCGEVFRSRGTVTVALPGNLTHTRFHKLFLNPAIIYMTLTSIQIGILLAELMMLLYFAIEWHFVLSISFVTLTNHYTLYKILRDYLITRRVYHSEMAISEKQM